jgi:PleD family two-component response regulator
VRRADPRLHHLRAARLTLPGVDGLEGLARLRTAAPEIPIVVLSDHEDEFTALRATKAGAQDYLIKGRVDDHLVSRAVRYAVERKRSEAQLLHQATHDTVTELPNRTMFLDHVKLALERSALTPERVAVLFVDIDRFKVVNDSLGHRAGDRLLCLVAGRLRAVTREKDMVARFGGDEFTILCDDVLTENDA